MLSCYETYLNKNDIDLQIFYASEESCLRSFFFTFDKVNLYLQI